MRWATSAMNFASSASAAAATSGVWSVTSKPIFAIRSRSSGCFSARDAAACSFSMAARGVPAGALSVQSVSVETFAGQQPRNEVAYPVTLPLGTDAPTRIFASATDSGLGQFRLTPRVEVRLSPEESRLTYRGSVTFSLVSGP